MNTSTSQLIDASCDMPCSNNIFVVVLSIEGARSNYHDSWEKIAALLNDECGTSYTSTQCKNKYENEKDAWKVPI